MNAETLKTLKASAKTIGRELEALGYPAVSHTHLLHALSKSIGFESWNALRRIATVPAIAESTRSVLHYPKHYVAGRYQANGRTVDVVRWEDPVAKLGDGFYAYDAETGQCLTPTAELLFSTRAVPGYEEIVSLLDSLEDWHRCTVCGYASEEGEFETTDACPTDKCSGKLVSFFLAD